jgi:hypothetical protein
MAAILIGMVESFYCHNSQSDLKCLALLDQLPARFRWEYVPGKAV